MVAVVEENIIEVNCKLFIKFYFIKNSNSRQKKLYILEIVIDICVYPIKFNIKDINFRIYTVYL